MAIKVKHVEAATSPKMFTAKPASFEITGATGIVLASATLVKSGGTEYYTTNIGAKSLTAAQLSEIASAFQEAASFLNKAA